MLCGFETGWTITTNCPVGVHSAYDPFSGLFFCSSFFSCCVAIAQIHLRPQLQLRPQPTPPPRKARRSGSSRRLRTPGPSPSISATSMAWSWCYPLCLWMFPPPATSPPAISRWRTVITGEDKTIHLDQRVITVRMLGDIAVANGTYTLHHKVNSAERTKRASLRTSSSGPTAAGCASTRSAPCCAKTRTPSRRSSPTPSCRSTFRCSQRATRATSRTRKRSAQSLPNGKRPRQDQTGRRTSRDCVPFMMD